MQTSSVEDIRGKAELIVDEIERSLPGIISRLRISEEVNRGVRQRLEFRLMGRRGFRPLRGAERLNVVKELKYQDFSAVLRGVQQIALNGIHASTSKQAVWQTGIWEWTNEPANKFLQPEVVLTNVRPLAEVVVGEPGTANPVEKTLQQEPNAERYPELDISRESMLAKTVLEGRSEKEAPIEIPNAPIEVQEPLAGRDIRGLVALLRVGRLVAFLDPMAADLVGKGIEKIRVPKRKIYASLTSERLLPEYHRLAVSQVDERSLEVSNELRLLDALLVSLENEAQWSRINRRRFHLITKKHSVGLSREEVDELATLQNLADRQMYATLQLPFRTLAMLENYVRGLEVQDNPDLHTELPNGF